MGGGKPFWKPTSDRPFSIALTYLYFATDIGFSDINRYFLYIKKKIIYFKDV
jgi:hypothetical protein